MSARSCRDCGQPFTWGKRPDGRPKPVNPDGTDHAATCAARQGQVPDRLKYPTAHHTSAWKLKAFSQCQKAYFHLVVEGLEVDDETEAKDAGKLAHGAIEGVAVRRVAAKDLASPVTAEELLASLDAVLLRERWAPESLDHAREILVASAPRIDLSCVAVDEHGPLVERRFDVPVGAGVLAGGILDLVELVGESLVVVRDWKTGAFREPNPEHLPAVGLYAAYAKSVWPEREVVVALDYLALGKVDEIPWSPEIEDRAKALARAVVAKTRAKVEDATAWPATFGAHCARCPFKARCETFQVAMEGVDGGVEWGDPQTLEELVPLVRHMSDVASVAKKLSDEWRERAKTLALGVVDRFGKATISGHAIKLTERERAGYTVEPSTYLEIRISRPTEEQIEDEDDRPLRALAAVVKEDEPCPTTTSTLGAAPAGTLSPATGPLPPGCEASPSSGPTTAGSSSQAATSEPGSATTPTAAASPTKRPRKPRAKKPEADPQRNSSGGGGAVLPPPENNGGMQW